MNQFDVYRGENPRILFLFWIIMAATLVLLAGLGWRQLVASGAAHLYSRPAR